MRDMLWSLFLWSNEVNNKIIKAWNEFIRKQEECKKLAIEISKVLDERDEKFRESRGLLNECKEWKGSDLMDQAELFTKSIKLIDASKELEQESKRISDKRFALNMESYRAFNDVVRNELGDVKTIWSYYIPSVIINGEEYIGLMEEKEE